MLWILSYVHHSNDWLINGFSPNSSFLCVIFYLSQKWVRYRQICFLCSKNGEKIGIFLVSQKSFHPYSTFPPSFLAFAHSEIVLDNKLNTFRNTRQLMLAFSLYFCSVSTEDSNSIQVFLFLLVRILGPWHFRVKWISDKKKYYKMSSLYFNHYDRTLKTFVNINIFW